VLPIEATPPVQVALGFPHTGTGSGKRAELPLMLLMLAAAGGACALVAGMRVRNSGRE
jgi:hypothetical protein